ncbi:MAG: hydroxymethylbilane synthase [Desulfovibrio sp.]|jgi:hydroxymethylbilane synthase|nr:hydroxymethylbilane synthase [Desulfovibrio sp.]
MKTTVTIATRGSRLALWQAEHIRSRLEKEHAVEVRLLVLKTKGDIILDVPLSTIGGKGLFVKEIEEALLDGRADLAVHSMKDVPMELPDGLVLGAVPEREDPADLLISAKYGSPDQLPPGARVGTSSLRRQAQLLALRPDCAVIPLRGNVDTRMRKLLDGEYDAIIMASAGVKRLALRAPFMIPLSPPAFLPAAGQGALGIEIRADRQDLPEFLHFLNHTESLIRVTAERAFLAGLDGGCQIPVAAHAVLIPPSSPQNSGSETILRLEGLVADIAGKRVIRESAQGLPSHARALGLSLAGMIKNAGGDDILRELYEAAAS